MTWRAKVQGGTVWCVDSPVQRKIIATNLGRKDAELIAAALNAQTVPPAESSLVKRLAKALKEHHDFHDDTESYVEQDLYRETLDLLALSANVP